MPRIHPAGWQHIPAAGAAARKLETLATLSRTLSSTCVIHHGIHWTHPEQAQPLFETLDFIVIGPAGRVLLIEQAEGLLEETPHGLTRRHLRTRRYLHSHLARTADSLRRRLGEILDTPPPIGVLLYCPDHQVRDLASAGLDAAAIVDASRRDQLSEAITAFVLEGDPDPAKVARIERYLADVLELVPEVTAMVGQAEALYTRLSGGLADWARRFELQPHRRA